MFTNLLLPSLVLVLVRFKYFQVDSLHTTCNFNVNWIEFLCLIFKKNLLVLLCLLQVVTMMILGYDMLPVQRDLNCLTCAPKTMARLDFQWDHHSISIYLSFYGCLVGICLTASLSVSTDPRQGARDWGGGGAQTVFSDMLNTPVS